ncbi:MAG TPA: hypothetical protein PLE42_07090, partial [Candidatus Competibacteraceae bacterium]|nr:hypothetical protein [Candidatus Competibacteraceae bacterium]
GYLWAAAEPLLRRDGRWLPRLAEVNLYGSALIVVLGLAILTPVADPIALADAMQLLLSDAALRAELAANGYRTLLARHSEDAIVSAYLDLYTRLLAQ